MHVPSIFKTMKYKIKIHKKFKKNIYSVSVQLRLNH